MPAFSQRANFQFPSPMESRHKTFWYRTSLICVMLSYCRHCVRKTGRVRRTSYHSSLSPSSILLNAGEISRSSFYIWARNPKVPALIPNSKTVRDSKSLLHCRLLVSRFLVGCAVRTAGVTGHIVYCQIGHETRSACWPGDEVSSLGQWSRSDVLLVCCSVDLLATEQHIIYVRL